MQYQTKNLFSNSRKYIATTLLLLCCVSLYAQSSGATLVGTWQGVIFSPTIPAANGASVQCVFLPQGNYTCIVSKPGIGMVRHWGSYQAMAGEIELEIKGHEPDSVTMPPTDHAEIVSLTHNSLKTRAWTQGSYVYIIYRRVQ